MDNIAQNDRSRLSIRQFSARALIATIIVAIVGAIGIVLWFAARVALVFFAAALLAIFLRMVASVVGRVTHLGRGWSFAIAVAGLLILGIGTGWLLAYPVSDQLNQLKDQLPKVLQHDEEALRQYSWGRILESHLRDPKTLLSQSGGWLEKIEKVCSVSFQGAVDLLVTLFAGFYLGMQSQYYTQGFLRLLPLSCRPKVQRAMDKIGNSLRAWLLGQITTMIAIGCLTWTGLYFLKVPGSAVIAALAGLLDFVPVLGTLTAATVACLFALLKGWAVVLSVICLFVALRLVEDQLLTPLVQRRAAKLPPGLTILSMFLFSELFGIIGLLLATPLLALILVAVRTLYVEGIIEDPTSGASIDVRDDDLVPASD